MSANFQLDGARRAVRFSPDYCQTVVRAISALGLDLLAKGTAAKTNAVLSPYSIEFAMAMAFAGAARATQTEMARVLRFTGDETELHQFRMEPALLRFSNALKVPGMKSAFDEPQGSADFDRMAPRTKLSYLALSESFHQTFLDLDEAGTEAAAAMGSKHLEVF